MENNTLRDKKAFIFYFLISIILVDFGNQIRNLCTNPYFSNITNPVFSFTDVKNTGSAFGFFQNGSNFLIIFAVLVVLFLAYYVIKNVRFSDKIELLALTLFNAGSIGNLIERIENGYVTDYINLNFIHFPVFNSFDIMICTGVFLYIAFILFDFKNLKKDKNGNYNK